VGGFVRYRDVVLMLARREFRRRYRSGLMGLATALAVPLAFLATYTFVFSTVIPVRFASDSDPTTYAYFLFAGLVSWNLLSETLLKSPRLFVDQAHFVRKAQFPPSALAVASTLAAFYSALVWGGAFVAYRAATGYAPTWWTLTAPVALLAVAVVALGLGLIVAHAGVFLRELGELLPPLVTLGLFLSPVFFPAERLAALSPWLVWLNPVAAPLLLARAALLGDIVPGGHLLLSAVSWPLALLAIAWAVHAQLRVRLVDAL